MTPYSLAFEWLDDEENGQLFIFDSTWTSMESIIDIIFIIEIIVCFNTSYYDPAEKKNEYVTSRKKIAKHYVKSVWFWIDCMAVMPRFLKLMES